jgi:hypothetical protein
MTLKLSKKRIALLLLVAFSLGCILLYLVQHYLSSKTLRSRLIDILEKTTQRKVTVSHWSPWSAKGVSISKLVIHDKEPFDEIPFFSAETITIGHDIFSVFRKDKSILELRFIRPELHIKKKNGRLNVDDLGDGQNAVSPILSFPVLFAQIVSEEGKITYKENGKAWMLENLFLELSGIEGAGRYRMHVRRPGIKGDEMEIEAGIQALPGSIQGEGAFHFALLTTDALGSIFSNYQIPVIKNGVKDLEGGFQFVVSRKNGLSSFELHSFKASLDEESLSGEIRLNRGELNRFDFSLSFLDSHLFPVKNLKTEGWVKIWPLHKGRQKASAELQIIDLNSRPLRGSSIRWENVNGKTSLHLSISEDRSEIEIEELSVRLENGMRVNGKGAFSTSKENEGYPVKGTGKLRVEVPDLKALSKSMKGLPLDINGKADLSLDVRMTGPDSLILDGFIQCEAIDLNSHKNSFSIMGLHARMPIKEEIHLSKDIPQGPLDKGSQAPWGWFRASGLDHDLLMFQDLKGKIRMIKRNIEAEELTYTLFKGKGEGSATVHLGAKDISADFDTSLEGSDLEAFARQNKLDRISLSGLVKGHLSLKAPSLNNPNIQALFEVVEPGGSLSLAVLEGISGKKSGKGRKSSSQDLSELKFQRAKATLTTKNERLMLDLIFHKVKIGMLFGLKVKKMEFRDIPIEVLGKAVRGKG